MSVLNLDPASNVKLIIRKGDTINQYFLVKDSNNSDFDFTSYSASLDIYSNVNDALPKFSFSTDDASLVLSSGKITLSKTSAQTATITKRQYFYKLRVIYPDASIKTWMAGICEIADALGTYKEDNPTISVAPTGDLLTITIGAITSLGVIENTSEASKTISSVNNKTFFFTGSSANWSLDSPIGKDGIKVVYKNAGTGSLSLLSSSGSEIYEDIAYPSVDLIPGDSITLQSNGTYWVVINKISGGGSTPEQEHEGLTILKSERAYWDFGYISSDEDEIVTDTIIDQTGNGHDAIPINSPITIDRLIAGKTIKSFIDIGNKYFNTQHNGDGWFDSSFNFFYVFSGDDAIDASGVQIFGGRTATNREFNIFIGSSGQIGITWGYTGTRFIYNANSAMPDGPFGVTLVRLECDFENDTVKVWVNGNLISGTYGGGNISTHDPSLWDNTVDLFIGSLNVIGVPSQNVPNTYPNRCAITGILSQNEINLVSEYLTTIW